MRSGDLIGQLLQAGLARGAGSRMQTASQTQPGLGGLLGGLLGGGGSSGSGGLGGLLGGSSGGGGLGGLLGGGSSGGGLGGALGGSGRASSGGGLGGLADMAGGLLGQNRGGRGGVSPAMGGGIGGLVGSMLGGGRMSGAMGGAAMGVIGMIAMNALRNMGQSGQAAPATQAASPSQAASAQPVTSPEEVPVPSEDTQRLLLMAMISAAKADGHVDDTEMNAIVGKLKESGADSEERDWILRELSKPLDIDTLVSAVPNLDVAAQVYTASILAITADTPQEIAYIDQLASRLGLQPAVRNYIHQSLGVPLQTRA